MTFGAVTALIEITGCHHAQDCAGNAATDELGKRGHVLCTPWSAFGQFHIEQRLIAHLPAPVPCRGQLGLWRLPPALERAAHAQVDWPAHDILPRHRTPDVRNADGSTSITVQRCCNGCGDSLGDVTFTEIQAAIDGRPLPDVRMECPQCRPSLSPPPRPIPRQVAEATGASTALRRKENIPDGYSQDPSA